MICSVSLYSIALFYLSINEARALHCTLDLFFDIRTPFWGDRQDTGRDYLFSENLSQQHQEFCRNNIKDENFRIIISENENRGLGKARGIIEGSLIEFLNDEGSNSRLIYELMTTLTGNLNREHVLTSNSLVHHDDPNRSRVWMKLLELPYFAFKGKHRPHGRFLQDYFVQKELTYGTDCSIIVYGFGYKTPAYCDPYILISARKKEEVRIVEERVTEKLRAHQGACSMCCKFPR